METLDPIEFHADMLHGYNFLAQVLYSKYGRLCHPDDLRLLTMEWVVSHVSRRTIVELGRKRRVSRACK